MSEKYLLFNLEDEKSTKLGEVISNPTCKKIINLLAEKELGASEIAKELKIPLNTTTYNISKLINAGLIEEAKSFWSVKGKKMPSYKIVNKAIVISPKKGNIYNKIKGVLPVIATGIIFSAFLVQEKIMNLFSYNSRNEITPPPIPQLPDMLKTEVMDSAGSAAGVGAENIVESVGDSALEGVQSSLGLSTTSLFLLGIWAIILVFVVWSIYRNKE